PDGAFWRRRFEEMGNLDYHALLRMPPPAARDALLTGAPGDARRALAGVDDASLTALLTDLGGHDLDAIVSAFTEADGVGDRPSGIGPPRRFVPPPTVPMPDRLELPPRPSTSTQEAFGDVLAALGREAGLAPALVTLSADVATTTHLSGWVNRRGVYALQAREDAFERHGLRSLVRWKESREGQHIELGIGEA